MVLTTPTTQKLRLCGKWDFPLLPGHANSLPGGAKGYYEYANDRWNEVDRNARCIEWLVEGMPSHMNVMEPFGGVGAFATVIENTIHPKTHIIHDIDKDCLIQLEHLFENNNAVLVSRGDAKEIIGKGYTDFAMLDFPFMTIMRWPEWEEQMKLLFQRNPKYVIWMDGSSRYLHFHKERYEKLFGGIVVGPESYAKQMSYFLYERYNYSISAYTHSQGCFYFRAEPGQHHNPHSRHF